MIVAATRLRVRSAWLLLPFMLGATRSRRQAVRAQGFIGGRLLIDRRRTFWTLTAWESEGAMRRYRGSGAHKSVMPHLAIWCDEASVVHWTEDGDAVPSWPEAVDRMRREGRPSRVAWPSSDHEALRFPDPRLRPMVGQVLRPLRQEFRQA